MRLDLIPHALGLLLAIVMIGWTMMRAPKCSQVMSITIAEAMPLAGCPVALRVH